MSTIADIEQEARDLCDADTNSYPSATMLRRINYAYEQVVGWLINADGTAQFDDTNYTNFPVGTYTMIADQPKYSFNDKFLQLISVKVKDANGNFNIIKPIDQSEFDNSIPLEEAYKTSGLPIYYDKLSDDTIKLLPAASSADTTLASGLKLYFKRTADLFTSAQVMTGTKEPGFASPYHLILSYMAALPYCVNYKPQRVAIYEKKIMDLKKELTNHYTSRQKDLRKVATMQSINFR